MMEAPLSEEGGMLESKQEVAKIYSLVNMAENQPRVLSHLRQLYYPNPRVYLYW